MDVVDMNVALCDAFGLTSGDLQSFTLRVHAGRAPQLEVVYTAHYMVTHPEIVENVAKLELVPKAEVA